MQSTYLKKVAKLSKTRRFLIVIGVLAIAVVVLYMVHSQRVYEQGQINKEITISESRLKIIQQEQTSSSKATLEQQLGQITAQFEAADAILSHPIQSFVVTAVLLDIAKKHALEVTEVTLNDRTSAQLGEIPCSVMSLKVGVEGDVENLVNFVTTLNSSFTTGVVKSIEITIPNINSGEKSSARMVLAIYSRQER